MKRRVIKTEQELKQLLADGFNLSCFAFDTETTDLRQDRLTLEGISLCDGNHIAYIVYNPSLLSTISYIFSNNNKHLYIAHNSVFDMRVLYKYGIHFPNTNLFDTQVACHLIDEESKTGLKFLAEKELGITDTMSWEDAKNSSKEKFYEYAMNDAEWTYRLYELYGPKLREQGLEKLFCNIEMPFQFVLMEMAVTGVHADKDKIKEIQAKLTKDVEEAQIKLLHLLKERYSFQVDLFGNSLIISDINFNSPKQVADIFFKRLNLTPVEKTESGQDSVGAKTLLVYKDHPVVAAYAEFKNKAKLLDAFIIPIQGYIQDDNKIRPYFNDVGTKTGRLSSSEPNCLSADTEVLTTIGWKRIDSLDKTEFLCGFDEDRKILKWEKPTNYISGVTNEWMTIKSQHINMLCTRNHRHLLYHRRTGKKLICQGKFPGDKILINSSTFAEPGSSMDEYFSKLVVAYQADGSLARTNLDFSFTKKRKYDRLLLILNKLNIPYRDASSLMRYRLYIPLENNYIRSLLTYVVGKEKLFNTNLVTLANRYFCEELKYWDGLSTRNYGEIYCSVIKHNVDIVHAILSLHGYRAKISPDGFRISVSHNPYTYTTNTLVGFLNENLSYFCVTMPSDNLMVRRGGVCWITKNCQQLPAEDKDAYGVRRCLVAPHGYKLISCDYSGQEVRVMAQQSKDPTLVDSLIKGQDMHLKVANQFYKLGIPDECLFETHPEYNNYKKKFKTERSNAKTITFGLAYGKGAYGFSQDFNISEEEAQKMMDKYFEGMPDMHRAIKESHEQVKRTGTVRTMAGRLRHFQKITKNDWTGYPKSALRQSFNFLIQGFSADMMRKAMVVVNKDKKPEWDLKAIMTIHDEAVYQVKEQYAEEAKAYIVDKFEHAVRFIVPVVADAKIGNSYYEVK